MYYHMSIIIYVGENHRRARVHEEAPTEGPPRGPQLEVRVQKAPRIQILLIATNKETKNAQ